MPCCDFSCMYKGEKEWIQLCTIHIKASKLKAVCSPLVAKQAIDVAIFQLVCLFNTMKKDFLRKGSWRISGRFLIAKCDIL